MNELLIKCRLESGLSQNKFAETLGISQTMLSLIESGKRVPSFHTAKMIAAKVNKPVSELFPVYAH